MLQNRSMSSKERMRSVMDQNTDNLLAVNVRLRDAKAADGPFVLWLEEVSMKEHATALWGEWRPSSTLAALDLSEHQIIEYRGVNVGCVALNWSHDCLFVARLFLGPDSRNRGIGAHVLRFVVQQAIERGIPVRLSVLRTNPAINFYLREGFSVEEETTERRELIKQPFDQS